MTLPSPTSPVLPLKSIDLRIDPSRGSEPKFPWEIPTDPS